MRNTEEMCRFSESMRITEGMCRCRSFSESMRITEGMGACRCRSFSESQPGDAVMRITEGMGVSAHGGKGKGIGVSAQCSW